MFSSGFFESISTHFIKNICVCSHIVNIQPLPPTSGKKSEILYGVDKAVGRGVYFMSNVKNKMDICFDHIAPSIVAEIEEYRNGYQISEKEEEK
jgi:hypothetical protein